MFHFSKNNSSKLLQEERFGIHLSEAIIELRNTGWLHGVTYTFNTSTWSTIGASLDL